MANILIIEHIVQRHLPVSYLLYEMIRFWKQAGHRVETHYGISELPPADVAVLNIDLTVTPPGYIDAISKYPQRINGGVVDLSRRTRGGPLLHTPKWDGPVIVKTNAHLGGRAEQCRRVIAQIYGVESDILPGAILAEYPVFNSASQVPEGVWHSRDFVVEKFIPQFDGHGFCVYSWTFLGERERCSRLIGSTPIVKGVNIVERQPVTVPAAVRAERMRLGLDFGRIEFLMCGDTPIVFDVHYCPGCPSGEQLMQMAPLNAELALGIESWLA